MGFCDIAVRDQAVVLLNMLYDGVDWQLQEAFRPAIKTIGQHFIVQLSVKLAAKQAEAIPQLYLGLSAPSPTHTSHEYVVSWHKITQRNVIKRDENGLELNINFGKFWKCGFYDWRIVEINDEGRF